MSHYNLIHFLKKKTKTLYLIKFKHMKQINKQIIGKQRTG